jgi:hypothetical protein
VPLVVLDGAELPRHRLEEVAIEADGSGGAR